MFFKKCLVIEETPICGVFFFSLHTLACGGLDCGSQQAKQFISKSLKMSHGCGPGSRVLYMLVSVLGQAHDWRNLSGLIV